MAFPFLYKYFLLGNLLKRDHGEIEKERMKNLRLIKREFIELRHNIQEFNEHYRTKIKRRKEEKDKRREERRKLRELMERELQNTEENCERDSEQVVPETSINIPAKPLKQKKFYKSRSVIGTFSEFRIEPETMVELGLKGVEIPNITPDWGQVSRTILDYHKSWAKERYEKQQKEKNRRKNRGRKKTDEKQENKEKTKNTERSKSSQSHLSDLSYFQSCLARPFAYEEFAEKKISCKENEQIWMKTLRNPFPKTYKRYTNSGEEVAIVQRQLTERNLDRARTSRKERPPILIGTDVNDRVTRLKFTNKKTLEERAELDRKTEDERLQTDKYIRRHRYRDKHITVFDISCQRPAYLRYRHGTEDEATT